MPAPRTSFPGFVLRSSVLWPGEVAELELGRPENLAAVEAAAKTEEALVAAVPVRNPRAGATPRNLSHTAVLCRVLRTVELAGGAIRVSVQVLRRHPVEAAGRAGEGFEVRLGVAFDERVDEVDAVGPMVELLAEDEETAEDAELLRLNAGERWTVLELLGGLAGLEHEDRVELLEEPDFRAQLDFVARAIELAYGLMTQGPRAESESARRRPTRVPGDAEPHELEIREWQARIDATPLSRTARIEALRELAQFKRHRPTSSEAASIRNYLDWMLELPWDFAHSPPAVDFETVEEVLAESHTGLRDVKDRVVEHLAVRLLARRAHGTVLCFLGPPGTGKSSMGRAVAEALDRAFVPIPGGTVTEEEQLRGSPHRQEGAVPGAILDSLHRAGRSDAVIMIDEIDKLELGGSGTSGGALLDLLDPEQNAEYLDHYLGTPYDLSRCIFIVTANDRGDIPEAVLDRLEIIEFSGFTEREKLAIAREHLLPRSRRVHGLEKSEFSVTPAALLALVRSYTEEAGVRHLQRLLNSLARKAAVSVVRGRGGVRVKKGDLFTLIGPAVVDEELRPRRPAVGVATGLAWTSVGGTLLPTEALAMPGSGRLILTGMLGEVMRESVQTAISFVRTRFSSLDLDQGILDSIDLHIHFPSGATPKDGPSAGLAIAVALISLVARNPVRHDIAMTGEVSLHGNVLPIGGLKEKLLAAVRAGISEVIVPERNHEEVLRLDSEVRDKLTIHLISHVQEAFEIALSRPLRLRAASTLGPRRSRSPRSAKSRRLKRRRRRDP